MIAGGFSLRATENAKFEKEIVDTLSLSAYIFWFVGFCV
jgi:hypothetical protein